MCRDSHTRDGETRSPILSAMRDTADILTRGRMDKRSSGRMIIAISS